MPSSLPSFTAGITSLTCSTHRLGADIFERDRDRRRSATRNRRALEVGQVDDALVFGVDQSGVVHEQREQLVVLVFVRERAVAVEAPQRLRARAARRAP